MRPVQLPLFTVPITVHKSQRTIEIETRQAQCWSEARDWLTRAITKDVVRCECHYPHDDDTLLLYSYDDDQVQDFYRAIRWLDGEITEHRRTPESRRGDSERALNIVRARLRDVTLLGKRPLLIEEEFKASFIKRWSGEYWRKGRKLYPNDEKAALDWATETVEEYAAKYWHDHQRFIDENPNYVERRRR